MSIGTIVVGLVLAGAVAAIIIKIIRDRKKGKCAGCACGCESSVVSDCENPSS